VGVAVGDVRREADLAEQFGDAGLAGLAGGDVVDREGLADDLPGGLPGVQRGERVLEDDLDVLAEPFQSFAAGLGDVLAVEPDGARGRLVEPRERPSEGRLATAGLADDPERFALVEREVHAVDGVDEPLVAEQPVDEPLLDREVLLQPLGLEERCPLARAGVGRPRGPVVGVRAVWRVSAHAYSPPVRAREGASPSAACSSMSSIARSTSTTVASSPSCSTASL